MNSIENSMRRTLIHNANRREEESHLYLVDDEKTDNTEETTDYLYYNFDVNNTTPASVQAIDLNFDVIRTNDILKTPNEWEYGVENFSCPASLPIYIEDDKNYPLQLRLVIRDISTGNITYATDAVDIKVYDNPLGINLVTIPQSTNLIKNGVYNYQSICNAVSFALTNAQTQFDIDRLPDGQQIVEPPYMRYFQKTGNFSVYAPIDTEMTDLTFDLGAEFPIEYPTIVPNTALVEIQFNVNLAKLFNGLYQWVSGDDNWRTIVIQTSPGKTVETFDGVTYYYTTTQWDVRREMAQFDKIIFQTTSFPIKDELIGEQKEIVERQLFDYILTNRLADREQINFFPQFIKWNNLESNSELRRIDMNVYIQYRNGVKYPLKLQPGERFSSKIIFKRKRKNI